MWFITSTPSIFLAVKLVRNEGFKANAHKFVDQEFNFKQSFVANLKIVPIKHLIKVTLLGKQVAGADLETIKSYLKEAGLGDSSLIVHQSN